MAQTGAERVQRHRVKQRARIKELEAKERSENVDKEVQEALDTMPPELAADCKLTVAPPGPKDERPRINWDIGAETHALMAAHAKAHGVTIDAVLYEIGVQFCMKRPDIYWAMKSAKIEITDN